MADRDWLIERPIAHRGLHDASRGIIENTPSAVQAAIGQGYAIEVDLQITGDGQAVVFHDETLDRLTKASGPVAAFSVPALKEVAYRETADRIQTLPELLEQVAGRVPLVLELKTLWDGDATLARVSTEHAATYDGPVALMSFDPLLVAETRRRAPDLARGIVSCPFERASDWPLLSSWRRTSLRWGGHLPRTRPHFLSYALGALGDPLPRLFRALRRPVVTWTVRSPEDASRAVGLADQITFEGFLPGP